MQKPFIQLFNTPNNKYFLDANKNEFVTISMESYEYLAAIMSGRKDMRDLPSKPNELAELESEGYLSLESDVKKVRHPAMDTLVFFLDRKLSKITLQLTQDCNFRCTYCVYSEIGNRRQREHSRQKMEWSTAKKAIDFLWEHAVDSESVNVGFYGGEPLLEFPMIERVVEYCLKVFSGKSVSFTITTNGTLFNDDIIRFCEKHDITVMISLDGPKEINDRHRVFTNGEGTFDAVMKQVQRFKEIAPEYAKKLQISMVIDPENDFDCINEVCLVGSDLDKLSINPALVDFDYEEREVPYVEEYTAKFEYQRFLSILAIYKRISDENISPIAENVTRRIAEDCLRAEKMAPLSNIDVPSGPCIPGHLRLFVNAFGNFYPCERVSETSPVMVIGSIEEGLNLDKAKHILDVGGITSEECIKCWAFRHCDLCAKKADDGSEQLSRSRKLKFVKHFENLQSMYSLKRLISPCGLGLSGKDAGHARKHNTVGINVNDTLGLNESSPESSWGVLLIAPNLDSKVLVNESDFINTVECTLEAGKSISYFDKNVNAIPDKIRKLAQSSDKISLFTGDMYSAKDSGLVLEYNDINVPVILVGGLLTQADTFEVVASLALRMCKDGLSPIVLTRYPFGKVFGFHSYGHIFDKHDMTEAEKIIKLNGLIKSLEVTHMPDAIIIEAPDAVMSFNHFATNGFGIRTYMLRQAMPPDYFVCCISAVLGVSISAVHVSNLIVDYAELINIRKLSYVHVDLSLVSSAIAKERGNSQIPLYNVAENGADELYDLLHE